MSIGTRLEIRAASLASDRKFVNVGRALEACRSFSVMDLSDIVLIHILSCTNVALIRLVLAGSPVTQLM